MTWLHRLAHLLRWNRGEVVSVTARGVVWIGFRCHGCGKVDGKHVAFSYVPADEEFRT
ncbi:MAG TPA: hypothetical protein VNU68_34915 [Verrucomicrobiae bacterium]|nr:hypothetical protein [Verrucomicrobiae bacterium]